MIRLLLIALVAAVLAPTAARSNSLEMIAASTVSGPLGEWFELGGTTQEESIRRSGVLSGSSSLRQDGHRTWIKVEEIK